MIERRWFANTPTPDLSILICSLKRRENQLIELLHALEPQKSESIEMIVATDNGEITTGAKRNLLVAASKGRYIVFIDDDDLVDEENYCGKILAAISHSPDCVGIEGIITVNGQNPKKFANSIRRSQLDNSYEIKIAPNHINPIRRNIAIQVPFLDVTIGEDIDYSAHLFPRLKSEVFVTGPIYFYNYRTVGKR